MKKVIVLLGLAILAFGCGRDNDGIEQRTDAQQYEVVQEGAAASTPDLTAQQPPVAMTGTNADTTSAFTLPSVGGVPQTSAPGSLAGTLPPPQVSSSAPRPTPRPQAAPAVQTPAPAPTPVVETQPEPAPQPAPAPVEQTETARQERESENEDENEEEPAPEPPPPPTTTTTT